MSLRGIAVAALVAAGLVAGALPAAAETATPTPTPTDVPATVGVVVAPDDSGVLAPGDSVTLRVTLTNSGTVAAGAGTVSLTVRRTPLADRAGLEAWLSGDDDSVDATSRIAETDAPALAALETRSVVVEVPAGALRFSDAGVYAVQASWSASGESAASGAAPSAGRTALVWRVSGGNPVRVGVVATLVAPAGTAGLIDAETLSELTSPGGALARQLDALGQSAAAVGIDPRLLASIRVLGSAAPPEATEWLARLEALDNPTFPLAYADSDLTAMLQAPGRRILAPQSFDFAIDPTRFDPATDTPTGTPTPAATPDPTAGLPTPESLTQFDYTYPKAAWPVDNTVGKRDLPTLLDRGADLTLLSSANLRQTVPLSRANAATTVGDSPVLVTDSILSRHFAAAVTASSLADWEAAVARLRASLAMVSSLTPGGAPTLLVAAPRAWSKDGYRFSETVSALGSGATATGVPFSAVVAAAAHPATLVSRSQPGARMSRVESLLSAASAESTVASVAENPTLVTAPRRLDLLALLSAGWIGDAPAWATASGDFLTQSTDVQNAVRLIRGSAINLGSDRASLPVTVINDLPQPVTVSVRVVAVAGLLRVEDSNVTITIEPDSQGKAEVPVQSLANGEAVLDVSLYSPRGTQIGPSTQLRLNVQAGWETAGTLVFGALVVAVFAVGLVRNIRRRMKARRG